MALIISVHGKEQKLTPRPPLGPSIPRPAGGAGGGGIGAFLSLCKMHKNVKH